MKNLNVCVQAGRDEARGYPELKVALSKPRGRRDILRQVQM